MTIEIHNLQENVKVDLELVERAVQACTAAEDPEISVSLVDDAAIQEVNARYLDHDWPTDVISFDYAGDSGSDAAAAPSGEVIVSGETALRVSGERGDPDGGAELVLYVVHGVLHLMGYDDKQPEDAARMRAEQDRIMESLGLPGNLST